jgi:hypothetical protein
MHLLYVSRRCVDMRRRKIEPAKRGELIHVAAPL